MRPSFRMDFTGIVPLACLLVAVSVCLYGSSVRDGFVSIDDGPLVATNDLIRRPLDASTLHRMLTSYDPELYVPLTSLSYHVDAALGGVDPGVFHLHNVLLHTLNVVLVFWLLLQLGTGRLAAFLGALLFAVHPINAEAVLWISARKDLLSSAYGLLSLNCFLRWSSGGRRRWYWLALIAFFCGLLAKVTVILLPLLFIALIPRRVKNLRRTFAELAPFGVLMAVFALIALIGKMRTFGAAIPLQSYPLLAAKAFMVTLGHIAYPVGLSPLYPQMTPVTAVSSEFWLPLLAVLSLAAIIFFSRRQPTPWRAAVFFLVAFVPSFFTFTKNGEVFVTSDRYAYLAFVGVAWIVGVAVVRLHVVLKERSEWLAQIWRASVACVFVTLFVASSAQAGMWRTDESFLRRIIKTSPDHALAYGNLGVDLLASGKTDEAEKAFRDAIARDPHFIVARINLAGLMEKQGRTAEAESEYRAAIAAIDRTKRIRSDDITVYYVLAGILESKGDTAGALQLFAEAAALGTDIAEAQYNLAVMLQKYGKLPEAEAAYRRALALDAGLADAHFNLAEILAGRGELREALAELDAVTALDPGNEQAAEHRDNIRRILDGR